MKINGPLAAVVLMTLVAGPWSATAGQPAPATDRKALVKVEITSDGRTWVSISNVRQPAQFKSLTVQLPAGVYEIVGRRKGYRDETALVVVKEGMPAKSVAIMCTVGVGG